MASRRTLLALASLFGASARSATAAGGVFPGVFSSGQSQTGQGGTHPSRTGPRDTDTTARLPQHLFMFGARPEIAGSIIPGLDSPDYRGHQPIRRLVATDYTGFVPYADAPRQTINAATPFLVALASRLRDRGLIPDGMFGFTCWQGGTPLNAFLPPNDPDHANKSKTDVDADGDGRGDRASNYQNLVDAIARYAELTRATGLVPLVPLVRFEHGEARITPGSLPGGAAAETARYAAAHLRMTDALTQDIVRLTGQTDAPIFLLGGWGGNDKTIGRTLIAQDAVRRLVATRPDRYAGPTSVPYMAPLYQDAGPTSGVHPSFVGRIIVGEAQARAADWCLDDQLRPRQGGFAPLCCSGIRRGTGDAPCFDLWYPAPPGAVGGLALTVDDWLPATPQYGFEYIGRDSGVTQIVAVEILDADHVRITLNQAPADPKGEIGYGFLPGTPSRPDGLWNLRGNLVRPTADPFLYAPILAQPPYELELPPTQRLVAMPQRIALPVA